MLDIIGIREEAFAKDLCNQSGSNGGFTYFRWKVMTKNNLLTYAPTDLEEADTKISLNEVYYK
jgi:hypothetical protein